MKRRLYYVFDRASNMYMYFCESPADAVAIRAFNHACTNDFAVTAPDLSLYCLGEIEDYTITPMHEFITSFLNVREDTTIQKGE